MHSRKDTKMATPLEFCSGMSQSVTLLRRDKTCGEHVSRPCDLVFALDLSLTSFKIQIQNSNVCL